VSVKSYFSSDCLFCFGRDVFGNNWSSDLIFSMLKVEKPWDWISFQYERRLKARV